MYARQVLECSNLPTSQPWHVSFTSVPDAQEEKKLSDALQLESQAVGAATWVLGIELGSPGRAVTASNHLAFSPAPLLIFGHGFHCIIPTGFEFLG